VLLLFVRGGSNQDTPLHNSTIPAHDGAGPLHLGFSVERGELDAWETHFAAKGVEVLSRIDWPRGGRSLYFRDPDGHLLELLTPGVWTTY
jgi:catechol 2,3-dioxygenase-like lactoylglutathione lyase family enzyme